MAETREIFAPGGLLASHLPGYEARPGQEEMAAAIDALFHQDGDLPHHQGEEARCLVIEAETGLGKTLAYLVPAALSGRKVVISTNTRNLQDQILNKEIPFVRRLIVPNLRVTCVKGRQNYLCLYRYHQLRAASRSGLFEDDRLQQLEEWIGTTRFADRAELAWLPASSPLWQKICCQSHFCLGSDCPHHVACFLNQLRREAASSQLLVVNHHLLFSDLAVRRHGYGEVLPRYESVIFDEAHHIEQVATTFFGFSFSRYQVLDLLGDVERSAQAGLGGETQKRLLGEVHVLHGLGQRFADLFPTERGRFPLAELLARDERIRQGGDDLLTALERLASILEELDGGEEPWEQYCLRCGDLASRLERILEPSFDDLEPEDVRYVHWYERRERNLSLSVTPIDISEDLHETLFQEVSHCVFTSATLDTGGEFRYFSRRLGLPETTAYLTFSSPFAHDRQTLLYVPEQAFPAPGSPGHTAAMHERMERLVLLSGGRALLLFTSFQAMELAYHHLESRLDFPLLRQGTMSRHELLDRFQRQSESVLFGVASFWEGVDIPGESLSLVIIDKLPFEVPSDPVIMARINRIKAAGGNPFFEFQVPRAILTLRQGVGRLMRRADDRGVVAILDVRLFTRGYGRRFLRNLPPSPLTRRLEEVESFFARSDDGD